MQLVFTRDKGDLFTVNQEGTRTYQFNGHDGTIMTLTMQELGMLTGVNVAKYAKAKIRVEIDVDVDSRTMSENFTD